MSILDWYHAQVVPRARNDSTWMQTASGRIYWPSDPKPADVDIIDIAHHLAHECRYNGACSRFYSVAEHSLLVAEILPPSLKLIGLLHDATEAYLKDIIRPIKRMLYEYQVLEERNWKEAIAPAFGLPLDLPAEVKQADNAVLLREMHVLMPPRPKGLDGYPKGTPADVFIAGYTPEQAKKLFLREYYRLVTLRDEMGVAT